MNNTALTASQIDAANHARIMQNCTECLSATGTMPMSAIKLTGNYVMVDCERITKAVTAGRGISPNTVWVEFHDGMRVQLALDVRSIWKAQDETGAWRNVVAA